MTEIMLQIAICDDEEIFGRYLEKLITRYLDDKGEIYSIRRFLSGIEFTSLGAKMAAYKIVFLDINMMELNGIETARKLRELSDEAYVIFVTAFINYTLEGYKVNAFRYLLKNADNFKESLEECLDAIFQKMKIVPVAKRYRFAEGEKQFFLKRLVYVESNLHTLVFHILEDDMAEYKMQKTLNFIEEDIDDKMFLRIHQSFLVNISFVEYIEDKTVFLVDGTSLPIAKSRYKMVRDAVIRFKGVIQ
ncbi:MAG: LytTR family DNA-binding domain-containing protein [Lachnospiraceae bacterium]|nr:LytTR family DNA-binding domain-containing protein [Lachnospiraceae bacterium]